MTERGIILRAVSPIDAPFLYCLLAERPACANISHREMPSFEQHQAFMASDPYKAWYVVKDGNGSRVGTVYLTRADEIGIQIAKANQGRGYARQAIDLLRKAHPCERYLANIGPDNHVSQSLFASLGFRHIQNTYELR